METATISENPEVDKKINLEKYAKENRVEATDQTGCVDGRYRKDQSPGKLARPGAHYGYVLALLATLDQNSLGSNQKYKQLTPENAVDMVHQIVTKNGGRFYMHTDEHDDGNHIGCGHAAKPIDNSKMYGLPYPQNAKRALDHIRELTNREANYQDKTIEWETLSGNHAEKAVFINQGINYTLNPNDETNMYFVYDAQRDAEYMSQYLIPQIADQLGLSGIKRVDFVQEFIKNSQLQTEATLALLAPDYPRYVVNMDQPEPKVIELPKEVPHPNPAKISELLTKLTQKAA